jgi:2-oxoglutarate ferredoxin oxidoreductase subunit beta
VRLHDGSHLRLRKFDHSYDATNRMSAMAAIEEFRSKGKVLTGILYVNPAGRDFLDLLNLVDEPLATLPESRVRPSREALDQIMDELR